MTLTIADILKLPDSPQKRKLLAAIRQSRRSADRAARKPRPARMNRVEADYASHLEQLRQAGEIAAYSYEAVTLTLAHRCTFTPDFLVVLPDGRREYHEVKGRKGRRYYAREDARIKLKVAAAQNPDTRFVVVWPTKGGGWEQEVVKTPSGVLPVNVIK